MVDTSDWGIKQQALAISREYLKNVESFSSSLSMLSWSGWIDYCGSGCLGTHSAVYASKYSRIYECR